MAWVRSPVDITQTTTAERAAGIILHLVCQVLCLLEVITAMDDDGQGGAAVAPIKEDRDNMQRCARNCLFLCARPELSATRAALLHMNATAVFLQGRLVTPSLHETPDC